MQSRLASRLKTRFTPVLAFVLDQGVKNSIEISRLINEALGKQPASADAQDAQAAQDVGEDCSASADGTAEEGPGN